MFGFFSADMPLREVKVGELGAWISRRSFNPADIIRNGSRGKQTQMNSKLPLKHSLKKENKILAQLFKALCSMSIKLFELTKLVYRWTLVMFNNNVH